MADINPTARAGEEDAVRRLLAHAPLAVTDARWSEPRTKANALLQAHFSRQPLSGDLAADQRTVVLQATRLLPPRAAGAQWPQPPWRCQMSRSSDPVVLCV